MKTYYAEKFSETTGIEIQSQHWGVNRQLSMEGIAVEYVPLSIDPSNNEENSELHSYISDDNEQDSCDSHYHMFNLLKKIFDSVILVSGMSTVWEDTDGCARKKICVLWLYI